MQHQIESRIKDCRLRGQCLERTMDDELLQELRFESKETAKE